MHTAGEKMSSSGDSVEGMIVVICSSSLNIVVPYYHLLVSASRPDRVSGAASVTLAFVFLRHPVAALSEPWCCRSQSASPPEHEVFRDGICVIFSVSLASLTLPGL